MSILLITIPFLGSFTVCRIAARREPLTGWTCLPVAAAGDEARRTLKPEIPATGRDGIPLRHELELEMPL